LESLVETLSLDLLDFTLSIEVPTLFLELHTMILLLRVKLPILDLGTLCHFLLQLLSSIFVCGKTFTIQGKVLFAECKLSSNLCLLRCIVCLINAIGLADEIFGPVSFVDSFVETSDIGGCFAKKFAFGVETPV
jgi:hypothetical protein